MMQYMKHPKHGIHVAYTPGERDLCIKNGWTDTDEGEPRRQLDAKLKKMNNIESSEPKAKGKK